MSEKNKSNELKVMAKAWASIGFMLWSAFPMFVLGWLISAIEHHPVADEQISSEPVYQFLVWWQGGVASFPIIFILMLFFSFLLLLAYALRKFGYSHSSDGMEHARILLRKFLAPTFLSCSAFGAGVLSGSTLSAMVGSLTILIVFTAFAGLVHNIADLVELE